MQKIGILLRFSSVILCMQLPSNLQLHLTCWFNNISIHYIEQAPEEAEAKSHFRVAAAAHACDQGQNTVDCERKWPWSFKKNS